MAKVFTPEENAVWMRQLPGKVMSACIAIKCGHDVLMVKAGYKDHWTFPGGIIDQDESPRQAALRETYEETGMKFDEDACQFLGSVYTASNGVEPDRLNFAFTVNIPNIVVPINVPNDEIEEARWVSVGEITSHSRPRGSYAKFQMILSELAPMGSYFEIFPHK